MKRAFDLMVAVSGLVLLSPLIGAIAVVVTTTSPGGALFRQTRIGRQGRPFRIVKFRTMSALRNAEHGSFDLGSGSRVTRVGRWLRATKLDELPQLWNVLVGDMSLVGPRPEVPKWTECHRERWAVVLAVRPGITDPASIEFRHEEQLLEASNDPEATYRESILPRKLELAEHYVRTRTFLGDLAILLGTVASVFRRAPVRATLDDSSSSR